MYNKVNKLEQNMKWPKRNKNKLLEQYNHQYNNHNKQYKIFKQYNNHNKQHQIFKQYNSHNKQYQHNKYNGHNKQYKHSKYNNHLYLDYLDND